MLIVLVVIAMLASTNAFLGSATTKARGPSSFLKMQLSIDQLKKRGSALPEYLLEQQNGAKATVRTFGGNVYTWTTKEGIEILGKRKDAVAFDNDVKAYAGGAPHCFPQFGPGALPQHGFARDRKFIQEERAKKLRFDRMIFKLVDTEETLKIWPYKFEYRYDITLYDDALEWEVILLNLDDKAWEATLGLHTYYDISSLKNIVIEGPFKGAQTINRLTGATGVAPSDTITISEATDMVYKGVTGPITITDSVKKTKTTMTRTGYSDTVIWSPYGNEEMGYDKFICVEPVQFDPVKIPVGKFKETHVSCSSCVTILHSELF